MYRKQFFCQECGVRRWPGECEHTSTHSKTFGDLNQSTIGKPTEGLPTCAGEFLCPTCGKPRQITRSMALGSWIEGSSCTCFENAQTSRALKRLKVWNDESKAIRHRYTSCLCECHCKVLTPVLSIEEMTSADFLRCGECCSAKPKQAAEKRVEPQGCPTGIVSYTGAGNPIAPEKDIDFDLSRPVKWAMKQNWVDCLTHAFAMKQQDCGSATTTAEYAIRFTAPGKEHPEVVFTVSPTGKVEYGPASKGRTLDIERFFSMVPVFGQKCAPEEDVLKIVKKECHHSMLIHLSPITTTIDSDLVVRVTHKGIVQFGPKFSEPEGSESTWFWSEFAAKARRVQQSFSEIWEPGDHDEHSYMPEEDM